MKLCALCLICHPRDHFSNRQWKTHKSICSTCVDDKQTRKICGVTPPKLEASEAKDDDDGDDLLQAQFPHMQPMISTAVVGPGDRTNGGTNKELQDVDPMFPSCFTAATSPPPLINNQVTSTTPTEDIVTLTAAATSNKQFPHSSQQAVEKGDNKNSKDTPSDEITLPKLGVSEANKDDDHEETKTEEEEEEDTRSDKITLPKLGVSEAKDKDDDHEETKTEEEEEEIKDDSRNVTRSNGATTADMVSAPVTDDDSKETKGGGNEPISPSSVSNVDLNEIIDVRQIQTYAVMELYRSI